MTYGDHVELGDWNGRCLLTVVDAELHDFLDDYFVEQDIEVQIVRPPDNPNTYQLLFPDGVSSATVHQLLGRIGLAEINRIASINCHAPGADGGV